MEVDKVIITNISALKKKYRSAMPRIKRAIARLVAADKKRGLKTILVAIDSAGQMRKVRGRAVMDKNNQKAVKVAVDAIYRAYQPDYIMILGAPDIVPHQDLENPTHGWPYGDEDEVVPSDIPYACEAPYSTDPANFTGPTRVVGRLPDLLDTADPAYLVFLLGTAARHKVRPRSDYQRYFSVSAQVWKNSTALSLRKIFGTDARMATSPPDGPNWTNAQLRPRVHFINCHGAPSDPNFYGQRGQTFPIAHSAGKIRRKISNGTVVAVECCYGAELYNPADSRRQAGICSTYLRDGAYGYLGSSTIAWGPSEGNGQADLICQYFLNEVLDGASLGDATLRARHTFAQSYAHLDPVDLKTLVQFNLLGDPSIHAVAPVYHALARTKDFKMAFKRQENVKGTRVLRREKLVLTGNNLHSSLGTVTSSSRKMPSNVRAILEEMARKSGVKKFSTRSFSVTFPAEAMKGDMKRFAGVRKTRIVHMLSGTRPVPNGAPGRFVTLVATEQNGKLIHIRRLHSR
jgi:hypothetical protein